MNAATKTDGALDAQDRWPRAWRSRWIEGGVIVAFWGVIILLTIAQRALGTRFGPPGGLLPGEALQAVVEYTVWGLLTPGIFWLSRRFGLEGGHLLRHLVLHALVALFAAMALNTFGFATFYVLVQVELPRPFSFVNSLFSVYFLDELIIYLLVLAIGFARDYFLRYQEHLTEAVQLRTQAAELHAQLAEARLQALRMQINPHFLFNTLHAVSSLVERDPRGVRRMIARLSELLRYTLAGSSAQEVPLHQELTFLNGYLEIQQIRFQGKLEVQQEVGPDVLEALVPNLILQPLVENAIKHGVSKADGRGRIDVRVRREGEILHLSVCDSGPGLAPAAGDGVPEASEGVGLSNTRERLENLYGAAQRLTLEPAEGGGLCARITLPYHTAADLRTLAVPTQE